MPTLARRAVVFAVAVLALLATSALYARPLQEATVRSGLWRGVKWQLSAGTWPEGSYYVAVTLGRGGEDARSCGSIRPNGISYLASGGGPRSEPAYVVGPVVAKARSVHIEFFDRRSLSIPTIAPPPTLYRGTRFFAVMLPCPAMPRSFVARSATGFIVARLVIAHRFGPKLRC